MLNALLRNRRLWEAPLLDLWSIPHFISGSLIAYCVFYLDISVWLGLGLSIVIAIAWELFEIATNISAVEHKINGASDLVLAQLGYGAGFWLFSAYPALALGIVSCLALVFVAMCALGWASHHWYGKK